MRGLRIAALFIALLVVGAGCESLTRETVKFEVENHSELLVCLYPDVESSETGRCLKPVKGGTSDGWELGCAYGSNADAAPVTVVITVRETGQRVYNKTAECRVWQRSDRTFVIEQSDGEVVVTDPLPAVTSTP